MSPRQLTGAGLIDDGLVERFRADLERLAPAPTGAARLGIAVSGGSDSLALLLLADAAYPDSVAAATVDHGLRAEAADEARWVERICRERGIEHETLRPDRGFSANAIANLQARARAIRYHCLAEWTWTARVPVVALGHHRDDVAESFLMRAARGAGVSGLAAMPRARPLATSRALLVRPLLDWPRATLAEIVSAAGLASVSDPSNSDPRFDRARVRGWLADNPALASDRLAQAAHNLRDVDDAMRWAFDRERVVRYLDDSPDEVWVDAEGLPLELKRRFVIEAVEDVRVSNGMYAAWRMTRAADLVRLLDAGRGGVIADVQARVVQRRWQFRPAPPRRSDEVAAGGAK